MNTATGGKSKNAFGTKLLAGQVDEKSDYLDSVFPQTNFWQEQVQTYALSKAKKPTRKNVSKPFKVENKKTLA